MLIYNGIYTKKPVKNIFLYTVFVSFLKSAVFIPKMYKEIVFSFCIGSSNPQKKSKPIACANQNYGKDEKDQSRTKMHYKMPTI